MPDNISFLSIPVDIRTPGQFIEIDHTKAVSGLPSMPRKLLLIGQRLAGGLVAAATPVRVLSASAGQSAFGRGSMLARMCAATHKVVDRYGLIDVWAVALDDDVAGVAAVGTLVLSGSVTQAGVLTVYIAGERVRVAASLADSAAVLANRLTAAINALPDLPVTAVAVDNTVTITARNKGLAGNAISVLTAYYDDDALPAGIGVAITAMAGGAANPDVLDAIAAMGEDWYYSIVSPYTDQASLAALEGEMDTRWGPMQQRAGHVFVAADGTHAALTTLGSARNSPHTSIWGLAACPNWALERAAAWAAVCEYFGAIDPAMPLQNLVVPGVLAPTVKARFIRNERELLLRDGVSTSVVDDGGNVLIERVITTYQTNPFGVEDESLLRLETKWTADYIRYAVRSRIALRYPRHKLADDGINKAPGQAIVTPSDLRGELIALVRELEASGLVENVDQFKQDLLVVRSSSDKDRVNAVLPPDLVNQFRVFAAAVQFRL